MSQLLRFSLDTTLINNSLYRFAAITFHLAPGFHLRTSPNWKSALSILLRRAFAFAIEIALGSISMPVTRLRAKAFRRESKNSASGPKIGKRPAFFPFTSQAFEETKRHCRRCVSSCSESGRSWNDEKQRLLDSRCSVHCPQRMWLGPANVDPLRTAVATALHPHSAAGNY